MPAPPQRRKNRDGNAPAASGTTGGNVRVALSPPDATEVFTSVWAKADKNDPKAVTLMTDHPGDVPVQSGWLATISGVDYTVTGVDVDGVTLQLVEGFE